MWTKEASISDDLPGLQPLLTADRRDQLSVEDLARHSLDISIRSSLVNILSLSQRISKEGYGISLNVESEKVNLNAFNIF